MIENYSIEELRQAVKLFVHLHFAKCFLQADCGCECDECHPFKVVECVLDNRKMIEEILTNHKEEIMGNQERWALLKECRTKNLIPEGVDGRKLSIPELTDLLEGKTNPEELDKGNGKDSSGKAEAPAQLFKQANSAGSGDEDKIAQILEDIYSVMTEDNQYVKQQLAEIKSILASNKQKEKKAQKVVAQIDVPKKLEEETKEEVKEELKEEGEIRAGESEELKESSEGPKIILDDNDIIIVNSLSRKALLAYLEGFDRDTEWGSQDDDELREAIITAAKESDYKIEM